MAIKNIEQLQEYILKSLDDLDKGKIDVNEASIKAKSAESINSSLKLQLAYNNMRGEIPNIPFLQTCNKGKLKEIEG